MAHVKPVAVPELIEREIALQRTSSQDTGAEGLDALPRAARASKQAASSMMIVLEGEISRQAHQGALVSLRVIKSTDLNPGELKLGVRRPESHSLNDLIGSESTAYQIAAVVAPHEPPPP